MNPLSSWKSYSAILAQVAFVSMTCAAGCGEDAPSGKGSSPLTEFDSTTDPAGICANGACAPPEPGDCPISKCSGWGGGFMGCDNGGLAKLRCMPVPEEGGECRIVGDCRGVAPAPKGRIICPPGTCEGQPTCASGTPTNVTCSMALPVFDADPPPSSEALPAPTPLPPCEWNFVCQ
ncbi:MAG: hypothetical protein K0S65_6404 [Labilithrix sp.]|nr:hypothetical protein [Labilithrix sp.]